MDWTTFLSGFISGVIALGLCLAMEMRRRERREAEDRFERAIQRADEAKADATYNTEWLSTLTARVYALETKGELQPQRRKGDKK